MKNLPGSIIIALAIIGSGAFVTWAQQAVYQVVSTGAFKIGPLTVSSGQAILPTYTVATLPTCNTAEKGAIAFVTDATTPTYNGSLTGSGTVVVPVSCSGSAWTSH